MTTEINKRASARCGQGRPGGLARLPAVAAVALAMFGAGSNIRADPEPPRAPPPQNAKPPMLGAPIPVPGNGVVKPPDIDPNMSKPVPDVDPKMAKPPLPAAPPQIPPARPPETPPDVQPR